MTFKCYCGRTFATSAQRAQHASAKGCKKGKKKPNPQRKKPVPQMNGTSGKKKPAPQRKSTSGKKKHTPQRKKPVPQMNGTSGKKKPAPQRKSTSGKNKPAPQRNASHSVYAGSAYTKPNCICDICKVNFLSEEDLHAHQTKTTGFGLFKRGKSLCAQVIRERVKAQIKTRK